MSIFHLVHGFDESLIIENVHQFADCMFAVASARLYVMSQDVLSFLNRLG
jgi:hypothetical protein